MNKLVPFTPGLILYIALSAGCGSDGSTPNGNAGSNGQQASGAGVIPMIDTSGSLNEVVAVPESTPAVINRLFDKYTKVVAPNGKPIHIFATSGVSEAQTVRARQILSFILKDAEGTQYGSDKSAVANALGDAQATLVYFETEEQALKHRDAVSKLGLGVQDLYAEESPVEGTQAYLNNEIRDAAYEEIFHMVHGYGIETALPAFHAEMVAAQSKATAAGIYRYEDGQEYRTHEYMISCIDVYYGLWAHQASGPSFGNEYDPWTPENLKTLDPAGYALVEKFFPPYLDWTIRLDDAFSASETFDLREDASKPYTLKSKFIKDVTLTGDNHSHLRGNQLDNTLTGNRGENTVFFEGTFGEYTITKEGGVTVVRDSVSGRDGTDILENIELLQFMDLRIGVSEL